MTRPTQYGPPLPHDLWSIGGDPELPDGVEDIDCCDDSERPDRALGSRVMVGVSEGDFSLIQSKDGMYSGAGGTSLDFDDPTTIGNLLYAVLTERDSIGAPRVGPSDWTEIDSVGNNATEATTAWFKIADGTETTVSVTGATNGRRMTIAEFAGPGTLVDTAALTNQSAASSYPIGTVVVTGPALLLGVVRTTDPGGGSGNTLTTDPDFTLIATGDANGNSPFDLTAYRAVGAGTYTFTPTGTATVKWGGILAAFSGGSAWVTGGYEAVDGDDETYESLDWVPFTKVRIEETPTGRVAHAVMDSKYDWEAVPVDTVPLHERRAASAALAFGTRDLGLGRIHIHWYGPHRGEAPIAFSAGQNEVYIGGRTRAGYNRCFWLLRGRGPEAAARSVLHELRHIRWSIDHELERGHRYTPEERAETEGAAHEYAESHAPLTRAMGQPDWPRRPIARHRGRRRAA